MQQSIGQNLMDSEELQERGLKQQKSPQKLATSPQNRRFSNELPMH